MMEHYHVRVHVQHIVILLRAWKHKLNLYSLLLAHSQLMSVSCWRLSVPLRLLPAASFQAATQLSSTTNVVAGPSTGSSSILSVPSTSGTVVDGVSVIKDQHSFAGITHRSVLGGRWWCYHSSEHTWSSCYCILRWQSWGWASRVEFYYIWITSLQSSSAGDLVSALCQEELGFSLDIAFTKRLGKVIPDKVQPLLVYVKQVDQAKLVISSARRLRSSSQPYTRDHVYINANLTKAASRAAYELRCRRRQAESRRSAPAPVLDPTTAPFSPRRVVAGQWLPQTSTLKLSSVLNPRFVPLQHFSNLNDYSCAVDNPTVKCECLFFNAGSLVNNLLEFTHFVDICKPATTNGFRNKCPSSSVICCSNNIYVAEK